MAQLFCSARDGAGTPVAFLHGFGGSHADWDAVLAAMGGARSTLAFDLPGHAGSLAHPAGSAAVAAKAVRAELEERGMSRVHLVGHSMGGAAAALLALMAPGMAASLTLVAPGGFGTEINRPLLRRFAAAREEGEIALLLEQFFGWGRALPAQLAAAHGRLRKAEGATAALTRIVETFFDGHRQKMLPVGDLARLAVPVKVVWGTQDRVLPTRQAHRLPGRIAVHIFEETGHMLPYEIPDDVAYLVLENSR